MSRSCALIGVLVVWTSIAGCGRRSYGNGDGEDVLDRCAAIGADGYAVSGSKCFTYHQGPVAYASAQPACVELGGNLAELTSAEDEAAVRSIALDTSPGPWIGLSVPAGTTEWRWVSLRPVGYANWSGNSDPAAAEAAFLDGSGWSHQNRYQASSYLCDLGWTPHPDKPIEYQALHDPTISRAAALDTCAALGGELASLVDDSDFQAVRELSFAQHWVAAYDAVGDGTYLWPSGEPVAPERWSTNHPQIGNACVAYARDAQLRSHPCTALYGALCQRAR